MSLDTAVAAIRSRAEGLWPSIETAVPLTWPNENFTPPRADNGSPVPFVAVEVKWNGGDYASIGAPDDNLVRRDGHIWLYAFIPEGTGETLAHHLVAEGAEMFEGQDFAGVVCEGMQPGGPVDSEDGNYFGQSAAVPFNFDETA